MSQQQPNNPLHGITLKTIVEDLVHRRGWGDLASLIPIRCFIFDPSVKSSLTFLRRTPWARQQVEELYLEDHRAIQQEPREQEPREQEPREQEPKGQEPEEQEPEEQEPEEL